MTKITLTEKEYEIMQILWKNEKPMLASEVMKQVSRASNNSIHHLLNRLMDRGLVRVAGNIKVVKAQSRLYAPALTAVEYLAFQSTEIFKNTTKSYNVKDYLVSLVKKNKNKTDDIIAEVKSFLEEYEKGLAE